ncbi:MULTISPECIES: hypothetical protein [unclassified Novosphingobium]|uniref:hypothetical protein n=1 Tax=unclassified Novosphingobium TaxID=2644732 RepID=UPI001AC21B8E|nr:MULTISPECIES: hypothetical protein [unclassified Novosphingobium]MBN9143641.1 hypothetical protein [Novosphingobium sp.]
MRYQAALLPDTAKPLGLAEVQRKRKNMAQQMERRDRAKMAPQKRLAFSDYRQLFRQIDIGTA